MVSAVSQQEAGFGTDCCDEEGQLGALEVGTTSSDVLRANHLLKDPSFCTFWCAVALGALAKGIPVESVRLAPIRPPNFGRGNVVPSFKYSAPSSPDDMAVETSVHLSVFNRALSCLCPRVFREFERWRDTLSSPGRLLRPVDLLQQTPNSQSESD